MEKGKKWVVAAACMMMGTSLLAGCSPSENGNVGSSAAEETQTSVEMEEQVVEEETAEETGVSEDEWRTAYAKYIESADCPFHEADNLGYGGDCYLLYINDDDIPELWQEGLCNADGSTLAYIENGTVKSVNLQNVLPGYAEKSGFFVDAYQHMDVLNETYYTLSDEGVLTQLGWSSIAYENLIDGEYYENIYYSWDGETVSEEEHAEKLMACIPEELYSGLIETQADISLSDADSMAPYLEWSRGALDESKMASCDEPVAVGKQALIQWLMAGVSSVSSESTGDDSWKSVYLNLISGDGSYVEGQYTPVYINDDDVPEIIVTSESGGIEPGVLLIQNGEYSYFATSNVYYNEKQGWFMTAYNDTVLQVCNLDGETVTVYQSGDVEEEFDLADYNYSVEGTMKIVSEADYQTLLSQYYTDETVDVSASGTTMSYSEFLAYLQE